VSGHYRNGDRPDRNPENEIHHKHQDQPRNECADEWLGLDTEEEICQPVRFFCVVQSSLQDIPLPPDTPESMALQI
jgi:hypothetical protein